LQIVDQLYSRVNSIKVTKPANYTSRQIVVSNAFVCAQVNLLTYDGLNAVEDKDVKLLTETQSFKPPQRRYVFLDKSGEYIRKVNINLYNKMSRHYTVAIKKSPSFMSQGMCVFRNEGMANNLSDMDIRVIKLMQSKFHDNDIMSEMIAKANYGYLNFAPLTYRQSIGLDLQEKTEAYVNKINEIKHLDYELNKLAADLNVYRRDIVTIDEQKIEYLSFKDDKFIDDFRVQSVPLSTPTDLDDYTVEHNTDFKNNVSYNYDTVDLPPKKLSMNESRVLNFNTKAFIMLGKLDKFNDTLRKYDNCDTHDPNINEMNVLNNLYINTFANLIPEKYEYGMSAMTIYEDNANIIFKYNHYFGKHNKHRKNLTRCINDKSGLKIKLVT
jgi:hypothetical protein